MVSILTDRRLQYLFLFKGTEVERRRLDYWLSTALVESIEDGSLASLLKICAEFVEITKECPTCIDGFLRMYLKTWDGAMGRESIFDLLVAILPTDFDGIQLSATTDVEYRQEIMAPLQYIFEKGDVGYAIALLQFYARLFSRWANVFGKCFLVGSTPSPLYRPPRKSLITVNSSEQRS